MYKCDYCDKEVKSESGLKRHMSSCNAKEATAEVTEPITLEDITDAVQMANENSKHTSKSFNIELERRIEKLKVTIRSCYDAETRYRLECELKDLVSKL